MKTSESSTKNMVKAQKEIFYRTSPQQPSTAQEWSITQLLQELDLKFMHPWTFYLQDRHFAFDFLIAGNLVLECGLSQSCPSRARAWLRKKATLLDKRFRVLKLYFQPPPYTLMLLEGSFFSSKCFNPNLDPLFFTDQLLTSITQLQRFLEGWKAPQKDSLKLEVPEIVE
ncbi:MAG: hypothetical protein ACE5I5_07315 [Candidatus Heimdallarchaeota archaeon]